MTFTRKGYSAAQISLHWLIATLVLFQLIFGESMTTVRDASEEGAAASTADQGLATAHYWVGLSILALVFVRIVVRLVHGSPAPLGSSFTSKLAKFVHVLFYILLFATPTTGLLAIYVDDVFGDIHSWFQSIFIALIVIHAVAALAHQFLFKDGALKRILVPTRS